jgi:hypothetical protein
MKKRVMMGAAFAGLCAGLVNPTFADDRANASKKGSLLIYPKVEIKWAPCIDQNNGCVNGYHLVQDTVLTIVNDFPADVKIQYYFVNGDAPLDPVFVGDPPVLMERGHPGWNWVDCQNILTDDQSSYWASHDGYPHGCQPFTVLDPGNPPGRPDLDGSAPEGSRILRGFVVAWAVDDAGNEIRWNHLSGTAMLIHYYNATAWEYNAMAYRALTDAPQGSLTDGVPGQLLMNGEEYDMNYDKLVLDFYAEGSTPFAYAGQVSTDVTLMIATADLRQDNDGPVTTKAKYDIWNSNEVRFSGTERCITCWDQTLLRDYEAPNHFLRQNLQTDKGKARIDGLGSTVCPLSEDTALVGVEAKLIWFGNGFAAAGSNMVGQGEDATAVIRNDIIEEPEEANNGGNISIGSATVRPVRK